MTDVIKFSSVKTRFLTAFFQLKYRGFELSWLIWKLYLQMNILFRKIYDKIFSCTICMSLFSHNNHKWKLSVLNFISHTSHKDREQGTIQWSFCNIDWLTGPVISEWIIFSLPRNSKMFAETTYWKTPWTSDKPAQWTRGITSLIWKNYFGIICKQTSQDNREKSASNLKLQLCAKPDIVPFAHTTSFANPQVWIILT
jgi:hypothetical protein